MTKEQIKLLCDFEGRVHRLISICDRLKLENDNLKMQFANLNRTMEKLREENEMIKIKYDNLKTARMIAFETGDVSGAKQKISQLVKEVDKCIALLKD